MNEELRAALTESASAWSGAAFHLAKQGDSLRALGMTALSLHTFLLAEAVEAYCTAVEDAASL